VKRAIIMTAAALAAVSFAGCSQIAQLKPVAGDAVISVRTATIDSALQKGITFKVAPVCTYEGTEYDCAGTAADGQPLTSVATAYDKPQVPAEFASQVPADAKDSDTFIVMEVKLGGQTIFKGLSSEVLSENARAKQ
jgi:hypothetical protein